MKQIKTNTNEENLNHRCRIAISDLAIFPATENVVRGNTDHRCWNLPAQDVQYANTKQRSVNGGQWF